VLEDLGDFSFVECRLETGRTHQVRIHLGESGTPLCGERVYDRPVNGAPMGRDTSGATRPALLAATLGIQHPVTGQRLEWSSAMPADMAALLARLRSQRPGRKKRDR
jgi:23S rRNA pseudouridine1911/1915/1917 synthase